MTKWLSRFLIFLLVVLVAISVGLTLYYFLRNEEAFSIDDGNGNNLIKYVNCGEVVEISVTRKNPSQSGYSLVSSDETIVKFDTLVREGVFRFNTLKGGQVTIKLETTNANYKDLGVTVYVGDGSSENPFYVRNYNDLSSIGKGENPIMKLSSNYMQTADIDMKVAKEAWTPIGLGSSEGFIGTYNGNGHKILNLSLLHNLDADTSAESEQAESEQTSIYVASTVKNAGLFSTIGFNGFVKKLDVCDAVINGDFVNAGVIAAINYGKINFVNVINANVTSVSTEATSKIGGLAGFNKANSGLYSAKIEYSSFNGNITGGAYAGGITGTNEAGLIFNCYARGNITNSVENAKVGGIAGLNKYVSSIKNFQASVVNTYSTVRFNVTGANATKGAILGGNLNNDGSSTIVLKVNNDAEKTYNRIYGNYYLFEENLQGVGGQANSDSAYIANGVLQSSFINVPTSDQIKLMNETQDFFDKTLALITYNYEGKFSAWDFNALWNIKSDINDGYPYIKSNASVVFDDIYEGGDFIVPPEPEDPTDPDVPVVEQTLKEMFEADLNDDGKYNGKYLIKRNIVLTEAWTPIGDINNPFNGEFYMAEGTTITGLIVNETDDNPYYGLFGFVGKDAKIENVTILGVQINLDKTKEVPVFAGALVGENYGKIRNCAVYGDETLNSVVVANKKYSVFAGGLVGYSGADTLIENCNARINVVVKKCSPVSLIYVGGIVGQNKGAIRGCVVDNLFNEDTNSYLYSLTANDNPSNKWATLGGIAGYNTGRIENSYFTGVINTTIIENVSNSGSFAGGIAGYNVEGGVISKSGTNAIINSANYAGGLVGFYKDTASTNEGICESYATGKVYGERVGGFAGQIDIGTVINCYNTCYLSGDVVGGYAAYITLSNSSTWGKIKYCYSGAEFDTSRGDCYWETASHIRWTEKFSSNKVAGYVENCVYNSSRSGDIATQRDSSDMLWFNWTEVLGKADYGNFGDENCKKESTYTGKGFSTTVWKLVNGQYPTLVNAVYPE